MEPAPNTPPHPAGAAPVDNLKHLEFIQAVIARLGNNGFLIKGWAITVAGLFFGFAIDAGDWRLAAASAFPTLAFWSIDAYFLRAERLFRQLYKSVVEKDGRASPFFMSATSDDFASQFGVEISSYWRTFLCRPVLSAFYGALLISGALVLLLIGASPADQEANPTNGPSAGAACTQG